MLGSLKLRLKSTNFITGKQKTTPIFIKSNVLSTLNKAILKYRKLCHLNYLITKNVDLKDKHGGKVCHSKDTFTCEHIDGEIINLVAFLKS